MKKALKCKHHCCSKGEPKFPTPPPAADPLPGDVGRPKFNELEIVTTFTYKPSLVMIDAPNLHAVIVVTDQRTNKPINRQDRLPYTAPLIN